MGQDKVTLKEKEIIGIEDGLVLISAQSQVPRGIWLQYLKNNYGRGKENHNNKKTKKPEIKLNPLVWEVPYNEDLVAQAYYVYSTNERKGSAKQKGRGEVSGGGKKPWKQKGTGRARQGPLDLLCG